ncbi:MAG: hypothetical protein HW396_262 [Candidatus Dadabacteria bacterium]|nr:hypothetical protein [Candidatus Dadabacteria bacterium]
MEKTNPYLSVIIPAYNEETRLGRTLEEIFRWLSNQPFAYEILVMCGDAKDRTDEVAEFYKAKLPHLRVVFERENHGKGYMVRKGMLEAKCLARLKGKMLGFVKHDECEVITRVWYNLEESVL